MTDYRYYFFDNAKFFLIFLVVLGHALAIIPENPVISIAYRLIYLFHMPAFIFIVGYFSKFQKEQKIGVLVFQYLIFQTLYCAANVYIAKNPDAHIEYLEPCWIMWFLLSVISMKIMLPYIVKLKYPLVISVIVAIAVGYDPSIGQAFSFSRTLIFLPFFILGYYYKPEHILRIKKMPKTLFVLGFVLSVFILTLLPPFDLSFLYNDAPYEKMGAVTWYAGLYRLAFLVWASSLIICFLALIPDRKIWYSKFGARTLQVYLLHGFIIGLIAGSGITGYIVTPLTFAAYFCTIILIAVILATKPVNVVFSPLLNPLKITAKLKISQTHKHH